MEGRPAADGVEQDSSVETGSERVARVVHPLYPTTDRIYVNAASWGLMPSSGIQASVALTQSRDGRMSVPDSVLFEALAQARVAAAALVGASIDDIVLSPNTSFGVNLGAARVAALKREGKRPGAIVVSAGEFPANVYPWLALETHGFEVRLVPSLENGWPDEAALREALDGPDVQAFALSAVQFATGYRADVAGFGRLCAERDILYVVDAIQELGAGRIDVVESQIDILACGAQKWLCSPWGSGFSYVAPQHREHFDPPIVSWLGFADSSHFEDLLNYRYAYASSGSKFEPATLGMQNYAAMAAAINMFVDAGLDECREYVLELQAPLERWIDSRSNVTLTSPRAKSQRAGILMFKTPDVHETLHRLSEAQVTCVVREGSIRVSPHVYNRLDEMNRIVEVLDG